MQQKDNVVLITGASSGIGRALAKHYSQNGSQLILCGQNAAALETLVLEMGPGVSTELFSGDLTSKDTQLRLRLLMKRICPDIVINCAGIGLYGNAFDHTTSSEINIVELNATAVVFSTIEAIKIMKEKNKSGVICNVSSAISYFPTPGMSVYAASKAFVNSFSEGIDFEAKQYGIRVLASCPGQVFTNFRNRASLGRAENQSNFAQMSPDTVAEYISQQIEKRKPLSIINWKVRLTTYFARLLPKSFVKSFLYKKILEICD